MTATIVPDGEDGRERAVEVLRAGGLVALPTDTVYGIGCKLDAPRGIERLFEAKNRPPERAIMLLLVDASQASELGVMPPAALALADAFWPGGLSPDRRRSDCRPACAGSRLPACARGGRRTDAGHVGESFR
jgi:L-threonylcarbamoyladenylate synthase